MDGDRLPPGEECSSSLDLALAMGSAAILVRDAAAESRSGPWATVGA